jgi:hypothetical protein
MKFTTVCICQIYNELDKGNLKRFYKYAKPLFDAIVVYDDCSSDGSFEYSLENADHVIRGKKNDFTDEISHKQNLLDAALKFSPDFIVWLDADEILTANATDKLPTIYQYCIDNDIDGVSLKELNLWRSFHWIRTDSLFNDGWFVKIWRVKPGIKFEKIEKGLHQNQYPSTIKNIIRNDEVGVLHFGFADELNISYKYMIYKKIGQAGYDDLDRLIKEDLLVTEKVEDSLIPSEFKMLYVEKPEKKSFAEALSYVEANRPLVMRPKYTIICLIFKSTGWLEFVYKQLIKYTPLDNSEIIFIANDADQDVIDYLKNNYIPHFIFNNTEPHLKEWYINNVYRAYNYSSDVARGDFLIFVNSDMAFSPGWMEALIAEYDGKTALSPVLVESGKYDAAINCISKDFGRTFRDYEEQAFLNFSELAKESLTKDSGAFMPLLIKKSHFDLAGRYPEGNIVPESDIFNPEIALRGQKLISGDVVLMRKLAKFGISHKTVCNSVIYHFQSGELEDEKGLSVGAVSIAICNDICGGTMGEKVFWNYLVESLPGSFPVDKKIIGDFNFEAKAKDYISDRNVDFILQNATFIDFIDTRYPTIVYLQDDLRGMGKLSAQQERNLKLADVIVANTVQTSLSYDEYSMEIIPVGVNSDLFKPKDRNSLRKKYKIPDKFTGIFVGSLNETKGWTKVKDFILKNPNLHFVVISKYDEMFDSENVSFFKKIDQEQLSELLNCANFFLIGSPVETQCLAAIEANLCDIPVLMPLVGVYKDFNSNERSQVGIFTNNFQDGLLLIQEFKGSPRQLILDKKLTINDSIEMWRNLFEKLMINKHLQNLNGINNIDRSVKNNFIIYAEYIIRNKLFKPIFGSRFLNLQDKLTIRFFRKSIVLILKKLNMYDFVKGIRDAFKL